MRYLAALLTVVASGGVAPASADVIPAETRLHVRLKQLVSSFGSEADTRISATLIAPVTVDGHLLLPLGTELLGHVDAARRIGLGFSRETAFIDLSFETLRLPDGQEWPIVARVADVDNAREVVDPSGRIRGIRATASFSSSLTGLAVSAGAIDPMLLGLTVSSSISSFRIPESEIIFPAGTELQLKLVEPLTLSKDYGALAPPLADSSDDVARLSDYVRTLPFRTATDRTNIPSDVTNLVLFGSRDAVMRAFDAAGWGQTDRLSAQSTYATLRAIVENQGYREAPMSILRLDGAAPTLTYAKTLNTFFKRHHLRMFGPVAPFRDRTAWTASSTHDSGIGFGTRTRSFIHVIDQNIDEERDKVVYDLLLTGCVHAMSFVERPWIPRDASNATGDALLTDGRAAVLDLNDCASPRRADTVDSAGPDVRPKPGGAERVFRDVALWVKNDAFRGNIVYQGYSGARLGVRALFGHKEKVTDRTLHVAGEEFKVVPGAEAHKHELAPDDVTYTPPSFDPVAEPPDFATRLEFSFNGAYSGFGNDAFSTQVLDFRLGTEGSFFVEVPFEAVAELRSDWGFAATATLNTHRYVSHEFGYTYSHTPLRVSLSAPDTEPATLDSPAQIRQFGYNVLVHVLPNGRRIRPYGAIGPGLQLIRVSDPAQDANRVLRFAFKDAGLIAGAWDFGSKPPFEGGGIFQATLQYGAGVKVLLTPHVLVRADVRETLSPQPDFWTKSYPSIPERFSGTLHVEPGALTLHGPLRHRFLSIGVGVAF